MFTNYFPLIYIIKPDLALKNNIWYAIKPNLTKPYSTPLINSKIFSILPLFSCWSLRLDRWHLRYHFYTCRIFIHLFFCSCSKKNFSSLFRDFFFCFSFFKLWVDYITYCIITILLIFFIFSVTERIFSLNLALHRNLLINLWHHFSSQTLRCQPIKSKYKLK